MPQTLSSEQSPLRSDSELAAQLQRVGPRVSFWIRIRGLGACRTSEQRMGVHVAKAVRLLRKRNAPRAEEELRAALAEAEAPGPPVDATALRTVLAELRRSLFLPEYEAALRAAGEGTDPESILRELKRARRAAEALGNLDDVRWVDQMIQGPKLQTSARARVGPTATAGGASDRPGSLPSVRGSRSRETKEEQRAQFRRVAQDSRAYAKKRLKTRP